MISKFLRFLLGTKNDRQLKRMGKVVKQINALAETMADPDAIRARLANAMVTVFGDGRAAN